MFSITVEHAKEDNSYYKYYANNEISDVVRTDSKMHTQYTLSFT